MENNKEKPSDKDEIRLCLILFFFIGLFYYSQIEVDDLKILEDIQLSETPKLVKGNHGSKWIEIRLNSVSKYLKIENYNYAQCSRKVILKELEKEDVVTVGFKRSHLYLLNHRGEELIDLYKANKGRKQAKTWWCVYNMMFFFLTFLPFKKEEGIVASSVLVFCIVVMSTAVILNELVGADLLF